MSSTKIILPKKKVVLNLFNKANSETIFNENLKKEHKEKKERGEKEKREKEEKEQEEKDEKEEEENREERKTIELKVKTTISSNYLFHYAHFISDFLFPLVCQKLYTYKGILKEKNLNQTIGVFGNMVKETLQIDYDEIPSEVFHQKVENIVEIKKKEDLKKNDFLFFQKFMWKRFQVLENKDNKKWPEVVLIQRGQQILLDTSEFNDNLFIRTNNGKERREIKKIEELKSYLKNKYDEKYECVMLEGKSLEEQVNLFYNAKVIIGIHGAALINNFFCKPGSIILEVQSLKWEFFKVVSDNLSLQHILCRNNLQEIINVVDHIYL